MNKTGIEVDVKKMEILGTYVLVKPVKVINASGLVDPDQYEDKPEFGRVVRAHDQMFDLIGRVVLFGKYSTVTLTVNGDDYLLVRQEDVIAVL